MGDQTIHLPPPRASTISVRAAGGLMFLEHCMDLQDDTGQI